MHTSYKHLLVISDGEVLENSLHPSACDRAERALELIKTDEIGDGELSAGFETLMREVEEEAAQADYPEGMSAPDCLDPEDYLDALTDFLSARAIDLHLDTLALPTGQTPEAVGAK